MKPEMDMDNGGNRSQNKDTNPGLHPDAGPDRIPESDIGGRADGNPRGKRDAAPGRAPGRRPSGRPGGRAGTKERILGAATDLFFARGVIGVSMDDIAAAVPVAKMTVYKHFGTKERLVGAVMERYVREQHDIMNRKIEESPDTLSALVSILDYRSLPDVPERFIRESVELYPRIVQDLLGYYRAHMQDQLRDLIVRGQAEGVIRRELSPHILMVYMQGITEFFARPDVLAQFHDLRLLGEQFRTMFLFGIAAPGEPPEKSAKEPPMKPPQESQENTAKEPPKEPPEKSAKEPPAKRDAAPRG